MREQNTQQLFESGVLANAELRQQLSESMEEISRLKCEIETI